MASFFFSKLFGIIKFFFLILLRKATCESKVATTNRNSSTFLLHTSKALDQQKNKTNNGKLFFSKLFGIIKFFFLILLRKAPCETKVAPTNRNRSAFLLYTNKTLDQQTMAIFFSLNLSELSNFSSLSFWEKSLRNQKLLLPTATARHSCYILVRPWTNKQIKQTMAIFFL